MRFKYRAKDSKGEVIYSSIEADSKDEAIEKICQSGHYPLSVTGDSDSKNKISNVAAFWERGMLQKNVTLFDLEKVDCL